MEEWSGAIGLEATPAALLAKAPGTIYSTIGARHNLEDEREKTMKYTVIIETGRESGYVAYVPALKGCVSQGKTREEVLRNVREAMEAYVEALIEDGLPVPKEEGKDTVELEVTAK